MWRILHMFLNISDFREENKGENLFVKMVSELWNMACVHKSEEE